MIQNELKNEAEIRRFLLGEMSDDERSAIEEKFVLDDGFFEQVRVVEDDLIEFYVRGMFSEVEKTQFERSFLTTEPRRKRVVFTRTMFDQLAESKKSAAVKKTKTVAAAPSVWDSIAGFFKTPSLAFGAGLAILLAMFGGWFLLKNPSTPEIARQITPMPTATIEVIQPNSNQIISNLNSTPNSNLKTPELIEMNVNANNSGEKKETPKTDSNVRKERSEKTAVVNPVLALFTGMVRAEGKTRELKLPKNASNVTLQLNLEGVDYKIYRAEIVTVDGETVSQNNKLNAKNSKINFTVPAAKLKNGDYIVKLSAINPQNETESVADYTFRISRK